MRKKTRKRSKAKVGAGTFSAINLPGLNSGPSRKSGMSDLASLLDDMLQFSLQRILPVEIERFFIRSRESNNLGTHVSSEHLSPAINATNNFGFNVRNIHNDSGQHSIQDIHIITATSHQYRHG